MSSGVCNIETFISLIESVGYKKISSVFKSKPSIFNKKIKRLETNVYKDFKEEEMILYKSITIYDGVIWSIKWRAYELVLNEANIVIFLKIIKSHHNNRLRKVKIQKILNVNLPKSNVSENV